MDTDGGSTVYFGSRASERFGRVYDKGRETRTLPAGRWWRWELEVKDNSAKAAAANLVSNAEPANWILGVNSRFFKERSGVSIAKNTTAEFNKLCPEEPTAARLLHWLASGVRPTVTKLVEVYGRERVLTALGIPLKSAVEDPEPGDSPSEATWLPQLDRSTK